MDVLELRKHEAILFTFKQVPYFLSLNLRMTSPPFLSPPLSRKSLNFGIHKTTWIPPNASKTMMMAGYFYFPFVKYNLSEVAVKDRRILRDLQRNFIESTTKSYTLDAHVIDKIF